MLNISTISFLILTLPDPYSLSWGIFLYWQHSASPPSPSYKPRWQSFVRFRCIKLTKFLCCRKFTCNLPCTTEIRRDSWEQEITLREALQVTLCFLTRVRSHPGPYCDTRIQISARTLSSPFTLFIKHINYLHMANHTLVNFSIHLHLVILG
jgi:hypothetical protein